MAVVIYFPTSVTATNKCHFIVDLCSNHAENDFVQEITVLEMEKKIITRIQ